MERSLLQLSGDQVRKDTEQRWKKLLKLELNVQNCLSDVGECSNGQDLVARNAALNASMNKLEHYLDDLEVFAQEQVRLSDEQVLLALVALHRQTRDRLVESCKTANRKAKKNVKDAAAAERKLLLEPTETGLRHRQAKTAKDQLLAAQRLTDSLVESHRLMTEQLDLSMMNTQALGESSTVIAQTHSESKQYGQTMKQSHSLISKLKRRDATDRALLLFGLIFFILVILYIVKSRLGYRFGFLFGSSPAPAPPPPVASHPTLATEL